MPSQLREIEEYAARENIEIVEVVEERGKSARGGKSRPKFYNLIHRIENHELLVDYVVVWELSRFSRDNLEGSHFEFILKKAGVQILSATQNINGDNFGEKMMRDFQQIIDEYESYQIAERTRSRMKEAIRRKGYIAGGTTLFGYQKETKDNFTRLVPDSNFATVKKVFQMAMDGMGAYNIAKELNAKNITKWGQKFTPRAVENILLNQTYTGNIYWGKEKRELIHKNAHEAAISEKSWQALRERGQNRRREFYGKNPEYIFSGIMYCEVCGAHVVGDSANKSGKKYRYYTCQKKKSKSGDTCTCKRVRADHVERFIINVIQREVTKPERLSLLIKEINQRAETYAASFKDEKENLQKELEKLSVKIEREHEFLHKIIQTESIEKQRDVWYKGLKPLFDRRDALVDALQYVERNTKFKIDENKIKVFAGSLCRFLENAPPRGKKKLIEEVVERITIGESDVSVEYDPSFLLGAEKVRIQMLRSPRAGFEPATNWLTANCSTD